MWVLSDVLLCMFLCPNADILVTYVRTVSWALLAVHNTLVYELEDTVLSSLF
jgi:hypothetical protein